MIIKNVQGNAIKFIQVEAKVTIRLLAESNNSVIEIDVYGPCVLVVE